MQFKIDENLPIEISDLLIDEGYDSKSVNDQKLSGTNDDFLINLCNKEDRILVTLDTDFSNISKYPPNKYNGIIVLRPGSQAKSHVIRIFSKVIKHFSNEPLTHHLWIVDETNIRIRGKEE